MRNTFTLRVRMKNRIDIVGGCLPVGEIFNAKPDGKTKLLVRYTKDKWVSVMAKDVEILSENDIRGRQYGYFSTANRAIRTFRRKYFASIPRGFQLYVNQIDEGCYEICGDKS